MLSGCDFGGSNAGSKSFVDFLMSDLPRVSKSVMLASFVEYETQSGRCLSARFTCSRKPVLGSELPAKCADGFFLIHVLAALRHRALTRPVVSYRHVWSAAELQAKNEEWQ